MTSARMTSLHPLPEVRLIIFLASVLLVFAVETTANTITGFHHSKTSSSSSHSSSSKTETATEHSSLVRHDAKTTGHVPGRHEKGGQKPEKGKAHKSEGPECGRVPIYEQVYSRSINKTAEELAARSGKRGGSRILYGLEAVAGEWPWIIRLSMCSEGTCQYCTGTLIDPRWLVTAAHCVKGFKLGGGNTVTATLGLYDLVVPDATSIKAEVDKLIAHPKADMFHNDIALLRLKAPIKFNKFIQPVCLAPQDSAKAKNAYELARDKSCYTLGYGLNENWGFPSKLQKLEIKTAKCDRLKKETKTELAEQVCILPRRAEVGGTCKGDSGGPDVCYDEHTNRWFLFGVVSFGPSDCNQETASGDWITASMDLTKYQRWISDKMKDKH